MKLNKQELYDEIMKKASEDADFRNRLETNPLETVEAFAGLKVDMPEGFEYSKQPADTELSEDELETISGGTSIIRQEPPIFKLLEWLLS